MKSRLQWAKRKQKVLARSELHYGETQKKFATYIWNAAQDVHNGRAHIEFTQRGPTTRVVLRARVAGEPCKDQQEGFEWLTDLAGKLKLNQPCGKLTMVPSGSSTDISVET